MGEKKGEKAAPANYEDLRAVSVLWSPHAYYISQIKYLNKHVYWNDRPDYQKDHLEFSINDYKRDLMWNVNVRVSVCGLNCMYVYIWSVCVLVWLYIYWYLHVLKIQFETLLRTPSPLWWISCMIAILSCENNIDWERESETKWKMR